MPDPAVEPGGNPPFRKKRGRMGHPLLEEVKIRNNLGYATRLGDGCYLGHGV
jgi:hypothetical protein